MDLEFVIYPLKFLNAYLNLHGPRPGQCVIAGSLSSDVDSADSGRFSLEERFVVDASRSLILRRVESELPIPYAVSERLVSVESALHSCPSLVEQEVQVVAGFNRCRPCRYRAPRNPRMASNGP